MVNFIVIKIISLFFDIKVYPHIVLGFLIVEHNNYAVNNVKFQYCNGTF